MFLGGNGVGLAELDKIAPKLRAMQGRLVILPDLCKETRAELLRVMARELREIADMMEVMEW